MTKPDDNARPRIDVSDWSDRELLDALQIWVVEPLCDNYIDSAVEEMIKRASVKHSRMAEYVKEAVILQTRNDASCPL
jgi:hypothetical protein